MTSGVKALSDLRPWLTPILKSRSQVRQQKEEIQMDIQTDGRYQTYDVLVPTLLKFCG